MLCNFENLVGFTIGSWMSITILLITYIMLNNISHMDTRIITIGPNPDFYILGICINNYSKYGAIVSFCFINSGMRAINGNVLHSWIINEIQDVKNKNIINTNKAYSLSFVSIIYNWFDFFMYMNILLSQIDMLLVEIFSDLFVNYFITRHYLHLKHVDASTP
jgi:hypothetical protein